MKPYPHYYRTDVDRFYKQIATQGWFALLRSGPRPEGRWEYIGALLGRDRGLPTLRPVTQLWKRLRRVPL